MLKHNKIWAGLVLAAMMAIPAAAENETAQTVVATVNGTDITVGHLIVARRALPEQYQSLPDDVLFQGLTQQLIQQVVLAQSLDGQDPEAVRLAVENETNTIRANEAVTRTVRDAVTDEAVQAAYDEIFANVEPSPEYNASHILVETEEEANALVEALEGGADFAELAMDKSTGPSGPGGGELGWFGQGAMVQPFEQAVVALEVGQVSAPVETQFGWHVVKLNDTRMTEAPALEDVRAELEAQVEQKAVETLVTSLIGAADITEADADSIDPSVLSNAEILAD